MAREECGEPQGDNGAVEEESEVRGRASDLEGWASEAANLRNTDSTSSTKSSSVTKVLIGGAVDELGTVDAVGTDDGRGTRVSVAGGSVAVAEGGGLRC